MQSTSPKVLIVEDSGFFRRALAINLSDSGFDVFTALDGKDALDAITNHHPNVIVLDMFMPKLNGIMVLRILRSNPATATIPVILLSASTKEEDVLLARTLGTVEYVSKTAMDFDDLIRLIQLHGTRHLLTQENSRVKFAASAPCVQSAATEGRVQ
jgi:CheY-like chemotaxis protein